MCDAMVDVVEISQEDATAINCKYCEMRFRDLKTVREMHDKYERDVREEHKAMIREIKACHEVLQTHGLTDFVRAILHRDFPDLYKDPTGVNELRQSQIEDKSGV